MLTSIAVAHTDIFVGLPGYDEEARYFEAAVRADKRKELVAKAYTAVAGVRDAQLAALKLRTLQRFQEELQAAGQSGDEGFSAAAARWVPCHNSNTEPQQQQRWQQQPKDSYNCALLQNLGTSVLRLSLLQAGNTVAVVHAYHILRRFQMPSGSGCRAGSHR